MHTVPSIAVTDKQVKQIEGGLSLGVERTGGMHVFAPIAVPQGDFELAWLARDYYYALITPMHD